MELLVGGFGAGIVPSSSEPAMHLMIPHMKSFPKASSACACKKSVQVLGFDELADVPED